MGRRIPKPVILAFGGFDPTGGAGVMMDARAIAASGGYPVAVPSCLALQSTAAFDRVVPISRGTIDRALACATRSYRITAVKVGMVGTRSAADALLGFIDAHPTLPVVLDPVIRATSGGALLAGNALPAYRRVLALADVLTPNLPEIEMLLDHKAARFEDALIAVDELSMSTGAAVVLKGGHFPWKGRKGTDIVFEDGTITLLAPPRKVPTRDAHGTGCAFASALTTRLASGDTLVEAATAAKALVAGWIAGGFKSAEGRWTLS